MHSFEFWFQAVEGYLSGTDMGSPARDRRGPMLAGADRDRLITVLCNYCVGETAALEGASGLIVIAPNRLAKVFLATQVADEGRHLEVFYHRLRELGVADPEAEIERRASRSLLDVQAPAARAGREQGLGGGDLRAERDPRVAGVRRLPGPRAQRPTRSRAEVLRGVVKDERRHIGFGENELGRRLASRAAHPRPPRTDQDGARPPGARGASRRPLRASACRATSTSGSAAHYLESVARLGFAYEHASPIPLRDRGRSAGRRRGARQRFVLDDTGFDEVPKKYRRFYRKWKGAGDALAPNEVLCPVCKVVIRSTPRAARRATASTACPACRASSSCGTKRPASSKRTSRTDSIPRRRASLIRANSSLLPSRI